MRVQVTCTLFKMPLLKKRTHINAIPPPLCRACRPTPRRHLQTRQPTVTHGPGNFLGELAQLAGRPRW